jgi:hypothetical protein
MALPVEPLLGVAGRWGEAEVRLAGRFDDLHQLLYTHGGISPTNAAVEEVAKLVFLRLWSLREPGVPVGGLRAVDLFTRGGVAAFKEAFAIALRSPALRARDAAGGLNPIWPYDEPFRLANAQVLAAAAEIVGAAVTSGATSVSDPLGTAFDALLSGRYDHAGGLGTYLTPSSVAKMMAEVAVELAGSRQTPPGPGFGDPFCGTGRFLVALLEVLAQSNTATARRIGRAGVFGADQSPASVAKASINMLLYGVPQPRLWTVEDSVTDAALDGLRSSIGLVLTNPPFGEGKYANPAGIARTGAAIGSLARATRIDPAVAGLVRSLDLLAPGGVLGVVLPDGVLESVAFDELVHSGQGWLAGQVRVAATISLPTSTFALSGTVAKTSAVFLRRCAPVSRVVLARVDHVGYLRQAGRAVVDPRGNELPAVSVAVRRCLRESTETLVVQSTHPLVAVVPADFGSYDPSRLDPDAMRARRAVLDAGGIELRELLTAPPIQRSRSAAVSPYVSVLHVDELGNVDWGEAATYAPKTAGLLVRGGQLIVSLLNPAKLRAAVVPAERGQVQVSAEFGVFDAGDRPYAVLALLYSEQVRCQLRPLGRGTSSSRRRIDADDVLSLIVPKLDDDRLTELDAVMRTAYASVAAGRGVLRRTASLV